MPRTPKSIMAGRRPVSWSEHPHRVVNHETPIGGEVNYFINSDRGSGRTYDVPFASVSAVQRYRMNVMCDICCAPVVGGGRSIC